MIYPKQYSIYIRGTRDLDKLSFHVFVSSPFDLQCWGVFKTYCNVTGGHAVGLSIMSQYKFCC